MFFYYLFALGFLLDNLHTSSHLFTLPNKLYLTQHLTYHIPLLSAEILYHVVCVDLFPIKEPIP